MGVSVSRQQQSLLHSPDPTNQGAHFNSNGFTPVASPSDGPIDSQKLFVDASVLKKNKTGGCAKASGAKMDGVDLKKRNKQIEADLLREQRANAKTIKLLLLGEKFWITWYW